VVVVVVGVVRVVGVAVVGVAVVAGVVRVVGIAVVGVAVVAGVVGDIGDIGDIGYEQGSKKKRIRARFKK
jgi:hypothetical protein